jgi:predicted metal-dependent phosphoesterase TrpH
VLDTVRAIKEQGGIVSVPHPFDRYRSSAIEREALYEVAGELDMVEVFNSRNISDADNTAARHFQEERGLVAAVGSDAHSRMELARSHQEIKPFDGARDFLAKMAGARLTARKSSHLIHFVSTYQKLSKRLTGRGIPAGLRR